MALLHTAATACIERAAVPRHELGLVLYAGVYRTDFVSEPAIAATLAGRLDINATGRTASGSRTLAFDVFDGGVGPLQALHLAGPLLRRTGAPRALLVAAEIENNAADFPDHLVGLCQAGSALLLEEAPPDGPGFGRFLFRTHPEHLDARTARLTNREGRPFLAFAEDPELERRYLDVIGAVVRDLLAAEGLGREQLAWILPPQRSAAFVAAVEAALEVPPGTCVSAVCPEGDALTSSLPRGWAVLQEEGRLRSGEIGLMISVGSGIGVGCALYHC
jgi:3-oxoacyl-[acyl-carrier-protein] synthase III